MMFCSFFSPFLLPKSQKFYELIYIFQVRWIASNYRAMRKIYIMWKVLATDLAQISIDTSFNIVARQKAGHLKKTLIAKNFLVLYYSLFDITYELNFVSLELQRRSGLLIEFYSFKKRIIEFFELMKTYFSKHLTSFLNSADCEENGVVRTCRTLEKYYKSTL